MRSNKFMLDAEVLSKLLSEKDLSNMAYAASYGPKYSSGSSVYTDQSIINPNSNELTYW